MFKIKFNQVEAGAFLETQKVAIVKEVVDKRQYYTLKDSDGKSGMEVKDKDFNSVKEVIKELKKVGLSERELTVMPTTVLSVEDDVVVVEVAVQEYIVIEGVYSHTKPKFAQPLYFHEVCDGLIFSMHTDDEVEYLQVAQNDVVEDYFNTYNLIPNVVNGIVTETEFDEMGGFYTSKVLVNLNNIVSNATKERYEEFKYVYTTGKIRNMYLLGEKAVVQGKSIGYTQTVEWHGEKRDEFVEVSNTSIDHEVSDIVESGDYYYLNFGQKAKGTCLILGKK